MTDNNDALDDILDSALDDFTEEVQDEESELANVVEEARTLLQDAEQEQKDSTSLHSNMQSFLDDAANPEFQAVLEKAFRELSASGNDDSSIQSLLGSLSKTSENDPTGQAAVDIGVAKTLQGMTAAAEEMEGVEATKAEEMGEEMMAGMMKEFEMLGEKADFHTLVDNMMTQLLSKDVMHEPMAQICERYPEWLAKSESHLSSEDYERYGKQYQYFQQIVAVYETEPDNYERLTELMNDMQECGQPPAEIVQELAPGLEFDDDGMPIMPNMGPGMMPGMPGSHPLPGQDGNQCHIM